MCSFNPIYGQGMTVAALEALTLRQHLERDLEPRPRDWFRDLAKLIDNLGNVGRRRPAFPGVPGRRTIKTRLLGGYLARLQAAAAGDPHLATAFIRVVGLVAPPSRRSPPAWSFGSCSTGACAGPVGLCRPRLPEPAEALHAR